MAIHRFPVLAKDPDHRKTIALIRTRQQAPVVASTINPFHAGDTLVMEDRKPIFFVLRHGEIEELQGSQLRTRMIDIAAERLLGHLDGKDLSRLRGQLLHRARASQLLGA